MFVSQLISASYRLICSTQAVIPGPQASLPVLAFVTPQVTEGEGDTKGAYEDLSRLVLSEFQGCFLQGHEVHAIDASFPGLPVMRLNVIKSYSGARQAAN